MKIPLRKTNAFSKNFSYLVISESLYMKAYVSAEYKHG